MDEAIKQACATREAAADFFSANPGQSHVCAGGAVHTADGRSRLYGSTTLILPTDITAREAANIARERGQGLYLFGLSTILCADSEIPGAVRISICQKPIPPEPIAAPSPPSEPPDTL